MTRTKKVKGSTNEAIEIELLKAEIQEYVTKVKMHNAMRKDLLKTKKELSKKIDALEQKYSKTKKDKGNESNISIGEENAQDNS